MARGARPATTRHGLLPLLLLVAVALAARGARALDFEMNTQTKCVYEEINSGALVVGDYAVVHRDVPTQPVYADIRVSWWCVWCGSVATWSRAFGGAERWRGNRSWR
jgi:hypothetical protein